MISYFGDFCVKYPYGKILLQEKQINVCERRKKKICSRYHLSRRCIEYLTTDQHHPQTWKLEAKSIERTFSKQKCSPSITQYCYIIQSKVFLISSILFLFALKSVKSSPLYMTCIMHVCISVRVYTFVCITTCIV